MSLNFRAKIGFLGHPVVCSRHGQGSHVFHRSEKSRVLLKKKVASSTAVKAKQFSVVSLPWERRDPGTPLHAKHHRLLLTEF